MISPETLRRFPLFAGLDFEALKTLAMLSQETHYKPGEWLFHEGDEADRFLLILEGSVELLIALNAQAAHYSDLDYLGAGDFIGWSAVIEPYCYTLSARTLTESTLISINAADLRALCQQQPVVAGQLMYRLAQGIGSRLNHLRVRFVSLVED